jgi:nitroreductase
MSDDGVGKDKPRLTDASLRVGPNFTLFSPQGIPESSLQQVFEVACLSPSEWNFQPWRWIIVRNSSGKQQLEQSTYIKVPLGSAPVVLICLADTLAWKTAPQRLQEMVANNKMTEEEAREVLRKIRDYYAASPAVAQRAALANAFVAMHQMLLAVSDCELSAYWVTEFDEQKVKTYFHVPDYFVVAALLAMGYREGAMPPPAPKLPLQSLVYKEKFGESFNHND